MALFLRSCRALPAISLSIMGCVLVPGSGIAKKLPTVISLSDLPFQSGLSHLPGPLSGPAVTLEVVDAREGVPLATEHQE